MSKTTTKSGRRPKITAKRSAGIGALLEIMDSPEDLRMLYAMARARGCRPAEVKAAMRYLRELHAWHTGGPAEQGDGDAD